MPPTRDAPLRFELYVTANGARVVTEEIHSTLDKAGRVELGELMTRIQEGRTRRGDVKPLGRGLFEGRLDIANQTYRLYYAPLAGRAVLLAVKFHEKRGDASQGPAMDVARRRLADWRQRGI